MQDISIYPKQAMVQKGVVQSFDYRKGWGWLLPEDGSQKIFVHKKHIADGSSLDTSDEVTYEQGWNLQKGKPQAEKVTKVRSSKGNSKAQGEVKADEHHIFLPAEDLMRQLPLEKLQQLAMLQLQAMSAQDRQRLLDENPQQRATQASPEAATTKKTLTEASPVASTGAKVKVLPWQKCPQVGEKYELLKELGTGMNGSVYLAKDREDGGLMAIKTVIRGGEGREKRIKEEVNIMKELNHPNVCKLKDAVFHEKFMFIIMEFSGEDLFDRIKEKIPEESEARNIFRQIAKAICYLHGQGISHRDLKPENICVSADSHDHVKVVDFGQSAWQELSRMLSPVGSSFYQAPEVQEAGCTGERYTGACDLWSLGMVLYVMLSGRPPMHANDLQAKKESHFPMDDDVWKAISEEAKDLIKSLLIANPKKRLGIQAVLDHDWMKQSG